MKSRKRISKFTGSPCIERKRNNRNSYTSSNTNNKSKATNNQSRQIKNRKSKNQALSKDRKNILSVCVVTYYRNIWTLWQKIQTGILSMERS